MTMTRRRCRAISSSSSEAKLNGNLKEDSKCDGISVTVTAMETREKEELWRSIENKNSNCKTPTAKEYRIPEVRDCPPAPMKKRTRVPSFTSSSSKLELALALGGSITSMQNLIPFSGNLEEVFKNISTVN